MPAPLRIIIAGNCLRARENGADVMLTAQAADAAILMGIGAINRKDQASILKSGYITQGKTTRGLAAKAQ